MLMALSMAQLHFLAQGDQNELQHDTFGHAIPLTSTLYDTNVIINDSLS